MNPALIQCLQPCAAPERTETVNDWWPQWLALAPHASDPVALAIRGGFNADRVGWAFASGYQAALRALVPGLPHEQLAAFCVTEAQGNRPRDIRTTITPQADGSLLVDGSKRWTTLGPAGSVLLIVGLTAAATDPARPQLGLVQVSVPSTGLSLTPMPATRFVPEVPHAEVQLQGVRVAASALLPGDGYSDYAKPFRTQEDIHVTLAVLAYLLREALARHWPADFIAQLTATLNLLSTLGREDALAATTHVALEGALQMAHRLYADARPLWAASADDPAAERWQRDAALFEVAGTARRLRAASAIQKLGLAAGAPVAAKP